MPKDFEIGGYPAPVCAWAIQTKLLAHEPLRRGPYDEKDAAGLFTTLSYVTEDYGRVESLTRLESAENTADWLLDESNQKATEELVHVG